MEVVGTGEKCDQKIMKKQAFWLLVSAYFAITYIQDVPKR
jgi:hypothetical protein